MYELTIENLVSSLDEVKSTRRAGLETHQITDSLESKLQESFLHFDAGAYLFGTETTAQSYSESLLILDGECDLVKLDSSNLPVKVYSLDSSSQNAKIYMSFDSKSSYLLIVKSTNALFFHAQVESTYPLIERFVKAYDVASLSPKETSVEIHTAPIEKETHKVFRRKDQTFAIGHIDLNDLHSYLKAESLDRARICLHNNDNSTLQEMIMVFDRANVILPAYHPDKDESILVIRGSVVIIIFDELGGIKKRIQLEAWGITSSNPCFFRIRRGVIHTLLVSSDYAILKETTTGPFQSTSSIVPIWALDNYRRDLYQEQTLDCEN